MADRDTISNRRKKFIQHSFKEFYYPSELAEILSDPKEIEGTDKKINIVHVSDAIIGMVSDISSDPNEAEFLNDYLSGVDITDLRREYTELAPENGSKKWSVPLAAGRVAISALRKADIPTTSERQRYKLNIERPELSEDLLNTIISLYEQGSVTSELAQGMLLLFEQDVSTASISVQRTARIQTRNKLKKEIAQTEAFTEHSMSIHATKSLHILNLILKAVISENDGITYRSMSDVEVIFQQENPRFKPEQIKKRISEYIAYGLTLIYTQRS